MTAAPPRRLVVAGGSSGVEPVFEERTVDAVVDNQRLVVHDLAEVVADGAVLAAGADWHHDPRPGGAIFRLVRMCPVAAGGTKELHASPTIDAGMVVSGSVDLALPGGKVTTLVAGDSFVLRGVQHSWTNRGTTDCELVIALLQPSQWSAQ